MYRLRIAIYVFMFVVPQYLLVLARFGVGLGNTLKKFTASVPGCRNAT